MAEEHRPPPVPSAPAPRGRWATIAGHASIELLLSCVLLLGITTIVRWVIGPSPVSSAVTDIHLQLLIVGVCVGLLLALLIRSPPGRVSGGHINPAISFAMWRFGVFPGAAVIPYTAAQLAGSVLGVLAGWAIWGHRVKDPPVAFAVLQPGAGWSGAEVFAGEALAMGVIVYLVGFFLQRRRLAPLVPWLVGFLIGAAIVLLGTLTGGSANPARQFGPAVMSGELDFFWVYLVAPLIGAALAPLVLELSQRHRSLLTHRLCGTKESGAPLTGEDAKAERS